jgi:hypothetical protein
MPLVLGPLDDGPPQLASVKAASSQRTGVKGVLKPKTPNLYGVNFVGCEKRDYNKWKIAEWLLSDHAHA